MNEGLETALSAARSARDWGNFILAVGILLEVGIDAFWPEPPVSFPVLHRKATTPLQKWHFPICSLKGFCVVLAGLVVLFGLYHERTKGQDADDLADKIRTNLQIKLIEVAPRAELLYGESRKQLVAALTNPGFKGQPIETRYCGISFSRAYIDEDTMDVAMRLPDVFSEAGWSADFPVRREGCNGTGIWVQVSPKASKHTRDAAALVVASLKALPMVADLTADLGPDEAPKNVNTVVITVEAHPL